MDTETGMATKKSIRKLLGSASKRIVRSDPSQTEFDHLRGHVTVRNAPGLAKSVSFLGVGVISTAREIVRNMFYL